MVIEENAIWQIRLCCRDYSGERRTAAGKYAHRRLWLVGKVCELGSCGQDIIFSLRSSDSDFLFILFFVFFFFPPLQNMFFMRCRFIYFLFFIFSVRICFVFIFSVRLLFVFFCSCLKFLPKRKLKIK